MFIELLFICLSLYYALWRRLRRTSPHGDLEPPVLPGALPFVGHAHIMWRDCFKLWERVRHLSTEVNYLGGVATLYMGPIITYVVSDPDDINTVAKTCLKKDFLYHTAEPFIGEGLFTAPLKKWKRDRKSLQPAFSPAVIDTFLPYFNSQAKKLVKELSPKAGGPPFDHLIYLRRNFIETICKTSIGIDFSDHHLLNDTYFEALDDVIQFASYRIQNFWFLSDFIFKFSKYKKIQDKCVKILHYTSNTVLKIRKKEMEDVLRDSNFNSSLSEKKTKFKPFMELILELSLAEGLFNDKEIREHVDTIVAGGHDTSANTMMYVLLMVASYPEVQEKLFQELEEVFQGSDRDVEKADLPKLVYMEAVIKETMRHIPLAPMTFRYIDKDIKLKNCSLSAGHTCALLLHGSNTSAVWGPDADTFRPERWLDPASLPESPNAFLGFMVGPRMCIGKTYAMMSMKTMLCHLLRSYRLRGSHSEMLLKFEIMLKPEAGYYVSIENR